MTLAFRSVATPTNQSFRVWKVKLATLLVAFSFIEKMFFHPFEIFSVFFVFFFFLTFEIFFSF